MIRQMILRGLIGFPIGMSIGNVISIISSLIFANGYYSPCVPELIDTMGSEINAVIIQTFLCGILGSGFVLASVIWQKDNWSLIKQTGIYFAVVSALMMPIAYFTRWMEHSVIGFLSYFGIFFGIFFAIWIIQYAIAKRNVKKINATLQNLQSRL